MSDIDLDHIIFSWKNEYGTPKIGNKNGNPYKEIPIKDRQHLLEILVETLKEAGADQSFFKIGSNKTRIIEACSPPIWYDDSSRKRRIKATASDLDMVVAKVWPYNFKTPHVQEKPDTSAIVKESQGSTEGYVRFGKELDRSIFQGVPEPEVIYDEEMSKWLGCSDE